LRSFDLQNSGKILLFSKTLDNIYKGTHYKEKRKMRRLISLIISFFLAVSSSQADTHYVSKTGWDIYPYTSWETAADSIQKGIDAASYGDTVMVGAGTYKEVFITMLPGIALIGAGMDSCIIDGRRYLPENYTMIWGADSSTIEGFHLRGGYPDYTNCVAIWSGSVNGKALKKIANNRISHFFDGVQLGGVNTEITSNIFVDNGTGIVPLFGARGVITNNTFTNNDEAISMWVSAGPTIIKNLIFNTTTYAVAGDFTDSMLVENNLVVVDEHYGISLDNYSGEFKNAPIRNNSLMGDSVPFTGFYPPVVRIGAFSNEIKNNIISGGFYGVAAYSYDGYDCNPEVSYNDLWNNVENYYAEGGATIDTSLGGNIYLDPMFVGGNDYHLQYGSPCIDAGDPNIQDPDSSRSDIGCYGGTWGETYIYQDYPPRAPDSLTATSSDTLIVLSWKPNTESDLSHYLIYKDTLAGFIPDASNILGEVPKDSSVFRDHDVILGQTYYYRLSAWDTTENESEYSDELAVLATDVGDFTEEENRPPVFQLFQNYPNPFNSSTVIWYFLPDVGYQPAEVEITIYNLLGKLVKTLVKTRQYPGEHKVRWDGKDEEGKEVASGIYFYRLKVSGLELVKPRKMVLLR
jgi:parallel beta-helix repeat protein